LIIRGLVKIFYPEIKIVGAENLPEEGCVVVGNHAQMNGPICGELYVPGRRKIWCAWQMMYLKEVPSYAFNDFWSKKPKYIRWFYKLLSYIIAPFSVCVFNNALTIPVYHDGRLLSTFRQTVSELKEGARIIIFPECYTPYNHIVNRLQDRFTDVAKLYYNKTGKPLSFVPMYIAPNLKSIYFEKPVVFNPNEPIEKERIRISNYLMEAITDIAVSLPEHIVVPYANIPKKYYNSNKTNKAVSE
jgi:hypothetical protein